MSMHEKPTETPMTQAEILAQVVRNPESIVDPVDADLAKLHKRLASSRTPEVPAPTPEGVSAPTGVTGETVHTRGGTAEGESYFGQLTSEMVKVNPTPDSAASTGRTGSIDSQTIRGRRSKGRAVNSQASTVEKPITPEKEPIRTGKYLDSAALLCEVYEQGGDFSYKVLEGEDEGQIIPVGDESRMRALMGDEWDKVDDATEPKVAEPVIAAEAGLEQEASPENFELFQEGEMWTKEIEVDGKKGREFILIEKISGDTIEISRERQGVGLFENGKSESLDAVALTKILQDEGFELEKSDLSTAPEKESILTGKYRNERGELCEIFQEGKDFYYRILEGEYNNGSAFLVDNVNRAIIDDRWTKVADDTQAPTEGSQETAAASGIDIELPLQETEKIPFLAEEGRIYRFTGNSRMSQDLRLVREGDRYYFLDTEDLKLPNDEGSTEEHIRELAVREDWHPIFDTDTAEKPDVDIELPFGEGEATPEQFLQNLPEGGEFSIRSKKGRQTRRFTKRGDVFLNEKTGESEEKKYLLQLFKNGWTIEPLAAELVAPETEIEKPPEQEEIQASRFVHMEKVGEQAFYVRQSDGFFDDPGVQTVKVTRAQKKRGGVMVEGYLIKDSARGGEDEKGVLKNIRKKAERLGVFHIDFDITGEGFATLDQIDAVAQAEGWVPMESAESLSLGEAPAPPKFFENESKDESKSELDELRAKVQEERFAYVETDYLQNSAWSKIKNILRLGEEREDVDTQAALQRYKNALLQLQEAELEQVKKSNLKGDALKERLSGILMYVKYNEEVELMRSRNEVRIQKRNKWEKTVAKFEEVGRWYNGLSRTKKFAVAAACGGLALAGGAVGGGSAALVTGVLFAKRAVATAGLAVTFDTLTEGILDKRRSSKMKDAAEESIEEYALNAAGMGLDGKDSNGKDRGGENTDDYFLTLVRNNIQLQTEDLEKRFKNRKREALLRRSGAWAAAATATLGYSAYQSWFGGESTPGAPRVSVPDSSQEGDLGQALRDLRAQVGSPASAASAPEAALGTTGVPGALGNTDPLLAYNPDLPSVNVDPEMIGQLSEPELGASAAQTAVESAPRADVAGFLKEHIVNDGDGKKGLWGIFEQRLPAGFEGDKNKAIQSLNNLVAEKVKNMSPEQLKAVGFRTSDINKIYPGDKLDFSKLLSQAEIQSVLDGKSVAAPSVASVVDTVSTEKITNTAARVMDVNSTEYAKAIEIEHERMIAQDRLAHGYTPAEQAALNAAEDQMIAESKAAELAPNAVRTVAAETTNVPSNPFELKNLKVFLQENPDMIPQFKNTLIGIRQTMFETPDVSMMNPSRAVYFDYRVQPMMGKVDMLRVLEYSRDLRAGVLQEYAFNQSGGPLHSSQIRQLNHLVQVAQDPKLFGTFGRVIRGESVEEYTRRIAALATATNKTPQLAMMLTGRAPRII